MSNYNLIGICGRKRHGKDTLGDYLVQHYGYTKIGFADALKEACRCIFGFNDDQLYGDLKEVNDEFWGASPRKVLQYIGTDLFRFKIAEILPQVNDEIWIKVVENKILQNPDKKYVITDVRFENELAFIKRLNGLSIKVQRSTLKATDDHISESFIDQLLTDCVIKNNGTLEQLYEKLNNILKFNDAYKKYNKYTKISDFYNIDTLTNNTLYVLDIDDTLMVYEGIDKNWWKNKIAELGENEELALQEWIMHIHTCEPKHTHADSFNAFIENTKGSNIICLTARNEALKTITEEHLSQIGIEGIPIYYSHGSTKGLVLKDIVASTFPDITNIVFIDDNKNNILSVNKEFDDNEGISVKCYYYKG